ncbi:adenosylcobalamin-dependent ribonucleoside-diphosphate reductase [Candidatus Pacearchaeota archaeon]|nr:adenosylcobalamin-dependent ribonucleoside-diphosphate reductase [Candidatus Pacearchaeota archaeon]
MIEKISGLENKTFTPEYSVIKFTDNPLKYSPRELKSYDEDRHIKIDDAYSLVDSQKIDSLSSEKLREAVNSGDIRIYDFKEEKCLDRLDLGKVYNNPIKEKQGLEINRYFTQEGENPFDSVEFKKRDFQIVDKDTKKIIFEMKNTEFPEWIDETSATIVANKYFFNPDKKEWKQKIKNKLGRDHEYSLKHLNSRVTDFITGEGWKLGYFKSEKDREIFRDELNFIQINGIGSFNSPVQFNAGLFNSYGIQGSSGINYWNDPETGEVKKVVNGEYIHPQLHACFIKGPNDDLESILQHGIDEGAIFASGSGIGQDIGVLREGGGTLSGGGKASGPKSFTIWYDKGAGTIKSGGKTRRAARMTIMRQDHPDIQEFVGMKIAEDKKALTLIQNGYENGMDGEAYTTVSLQNTNFSVRLDDYFFKTLDQGGKIELRGIKDKKVKGKVSADSLLKEISFGSWRIGDPAVQYDSQIQKMHTSKNSGKIKSSNPCGEFMNIDNTSCNLYANRLTAFIDENGNFDVEKYKYSVRIAAIAQDIANKAASYPVKDIASISPEFSSIGQGFADLGSLLMRKGLAYDSDEARSLTAAISALMTGTVYETSIEMAEKLGTFEHYEFNQQPMLNVMKKHKKNLKDVDWEKMEDPNLKRAAYKSWNNILKEGKEHGFRNSQTTVLAPTGTTSFLMGCSTTGIEPAFSLSTTKNLAGGGHVTITNKDVKFSLNNLGYSEENIKDISKFVEKYNTLIDAPHLNPEHYPIFDTAIGNNGKGSISLEGHMKMMGAAQPFISGAISKTNNLPKESTVKDIYDGYLLGDELDLKGVTIFRSSSKPVAAYGDSEVGVKLKRGEKEELPFSGDSFRQEIKINQAPFLINIGEYEDGRPGEIVINSYTSDSTLGAVLRTAGISASSALKRGSDLEDVFKGWIGHGFEPRGLVKIENSKGVIKPHPYIKEASSPLDFAGRLALLHYKGEKDFATEPDQVNLGDLRGAKNGAFKTYQRMEVDEWNIDDVLKDAETGGFVNESEFSNGNKKKKNGNNKGLLCTTGCGGLMVQTGPNCFQCNSCGEKRGGCGG